MLSLGHLTPLGHEKLGEAIPHWREAQAAMVCALRVDDIELAPFLHGLERARTLSSQLDDAV